MVKKGHCHLHTDNRLVEDKAVDSYTPNVTNNGHSSPNSIEYARFDERVLPPIFADEQVHICHWPLAGIREYFIFSMRYIVCNKLPQRGNLVRML